MSLREEQSAFAKDISTFLGFIHKMGWEVTFGEALRTDFQQKEYLRTGFTKTLNSNHLVKCALDLNFFFQGQIVQDKASLQKFGDYWESLHPKNRWGGNFKTFQDCPHFERNQY